MDNHAEADDADRQDEQAVMTFTVRDAKPIAGKSLYALVEVEVEIAGVSLTIRGVQARHAFSGGTEVVLPTYRDPHGVWRTAVVLPEEARGPLADAVMLFLVEEGLARRRYGPQASEL